MMAETSSKRESDHTKPKSSIFSVIKQLLTEILSEQQKKLAISVKAIETYEKNLNIFA